VCVCATLYVCVCRLKTLCFDRAKPALVQYLIVVLKKMIYQTIALATLFAAANVNAVYFSDPVQQVRC
jgi:hypothetical protein